MTFTNPNVRQNANSLFQIVLSCFLQFLSGSTFSLGVFSDAIQRSARPPHVLDDVWGSSIGKMNVMSTLVMLIAALYLSRSKCVSRNPADQSSMLTCIRGQSFLATVGFAALFLAGFGVSISSRFLVTFAIVMQAFPLSIYYLLCAELLPMWYPTHPGLAVGIGQMCFGLGVVSFSSFCHWLEISLGCKNALYSTATVLTLCSLLGTLYINIPDNVHRRLMSQNDEEASLFQNDKCLSWQTMLRVPSFWLYILVIFNAMAPFSFYGYFYQVGLSFERPMEQLVRVFQLATFGSTVFRLVAGFMVDALKTRSGFFFSGGKNTTALLLFLQSIFFFLLVPISQAKCYTGFAVLSSLLLINVDMCTSVSSLLARDFFGGANCSFVFGVGGGIAIGLGSALATKLFSLASGMKAGIVMTPVSFCRAYMVLGMLSILGLLVVTVMQRCEEAFTYNPEKLGTYGSVYEIVREDMHFDSEYRLHTVVSKR